jgi:Tfp pilus assembly protein PilN
MLRQDINLYRPFKPFKPRLSFSPWKVLWISNAFFLLLFVSIFLWTIWNKHQLYTQNKTLLSQNKLFEEKFTQLKKQYPSIFFSSNASQTINELQQNIDSQGKLFDALANAQPFSSVLVGLSQVITPNVWLTTISITKHGDQITLKGKSLDIKDIQSYLSKIHANKTYSQYTATISNIENPDDTAANQDLTFEINIAKNPS